jgi:hypothetical protein
LAEPGVTQASLVDAASDSLPSVARKVTIKVGADRTFTECSFEPFVDLCEIESSWTCGCVTPEIPGPALVR